MQETVVYILGAGFSAPLGLPLMNNFITRSRDLYAQNPERYKSFASVFNRLDQMAKVKNYFSADLSNIEEVLSILEMDASLSGQRTRSTFLSYISGVIEGLTPPMKPYQGGLPGNWNDFLFGGGHWEPYGRFAASLFGLAVTWDRSGNSWKFSPRSMTPHYHVITLNYDLVLETAIGFLRQQYGAPDHIGFVRPSSQKEPLDLDQRAVLCKLHGSTDQGQIVPPTWNKALRRGILPEWRAAHAALSKANHIRVIGYSLPDGDAYFRYLLKAGMLRSEHLKTFDVVCLDGSSKAVDARYANFVDFPFFRFRSGRTEDYLDAIGAPALDRNTGTATFGRLETAHQKFFA